LVEAHKRQITRFVCRAITDHYPYSFGSTTNGPTTPGISAPANATCPKTGAKPISHFGDINSGIGVAWKSFLHCFAVHRAQLDHPEFSRFDLKSLRTGIMAGAPCPVEVMKRVNSEMNMGEVTIAYGMTETSPISMQSAVDDPLQKRVSTVGRIQPHVEVKRRKFRTFTRDLRQMRAWLKNCQVTEIAMESTGQYWRPLWNLLEGEFGKLILVNPQHIKGLSGYKTDPKDAQWIADLLEGGKLRGSWVPPRAIRELRLLK